jgi:hypothetical protein
MFINLKLALKVINQILNWKMKLISFATGLALLATKTFALFEGINVLNSDNWSNTVEND